ncbi:MAG: IS1634 family transposase [Chlamydiota bacterium]
MSDLGDGYCGQEFRVCYEGVEQRWIVVFSKAAYDRERRTLRKRCGKDSEKELKAYKKLCREVFACESDALKHLDRSIKKYKHLDIKNATVLKVQKHPTVGRPKKGSSPQTVGYQITGYPVCCLKKKAQLEELKGYFILATNDLDRASFSMRDVLKTYKDQQSVERGFRFLKSPDFLVSSFFF